MAKEGYTAYIYDDRGYYISPMTLYGNAMPPVTSTETPPPAGPWEEVWPKWMKTSWVLAKDYYGKEYWPAGSTWEDWPRIWDQRGELPPGATSTRPPDPNGPRKDAINQRIFQIQLDMNDLKQEREALYARVFLDKATKSDKDDLQDIINKEDSLNKEREALIEEFNTLIKVNK